MSGVRISGILVVCICALLWPDAASARPGLSCNAATSLFERARAAAMARLAVLPARKSETAEDQIRNPADAIAADRDRLAGAARRHGTGSMESAVAGLKLAQRLRLAARFQPALDALKDAEAILLELDPSGPAMAELLRERGIAYSNMRRREEAVTALRQSTALYADGPARDPKLEARNHQTLADVLRGLSRFHEALDALGQAQPLYEAGPARSDKNLAEVLVDKSIILSRLGDKQAGLAQVIRAAALAGEKLGLADRTTARALHNLGIAHRSLGAMSQAFAAIATAHAIYEHLAVPVRAAEALEDTSRSLALMRCFAPAIHFEEEARRSYEAQYGATHVRVADAQGRLGILNRDGGGYAMAETHFNAAIAIFDALLGPENPRSAVLLRERAGVEARLGKPDDALNSALHGLRNLAQGNAPDELRTSLEALAMLLKAQGNAPAAILFAKKAVNTQQEIRARNRGLPPELAASLAERYRGLYLFLADLLIGQGRIEEAQRVLDLIKGQEMLDFVRGGSNPPPADGRAPSTQTERQALNGIEALLKQPFATAAELEALLAKAKAGPLDDLGKVRLGQLKAAFNAHYKSFQTDVKTLIDGLERETAAVQGEIVQLHLDMLGQTRKKLKPFHGEAVLLQIASLNDAVHIFLTGPNTQVHREMPMPRAALAKLAFEGWSATARAAPAADEKLRKLYDALIRPVEGDLRHSGARVVMLNLEGFLRYIPFAALNSGERYFIEDYALAMQTPAAETVYAKGDRDRARAVGFGVSDALGDFAGLPGVAAELETIFEGSDNDGVFAGKPRLNRDFDADQFAAALEERPEFVHIASHFKLEPGDESQSFLLLGNGEALTLDAIRTDARFQFTGVDLLTLSACETAGEVGSDGKEVESFATLAQASGASSVMATLWPIADESTAGLMAAFYRGLLDQGLDKATALRQAQVAMIGRAPSTATDVARGVQPEEMVEPDGVPGRPPLSHPYYWSAFILMGNWL